MALTLIIVLAICLTGCRQSPVLVDDIYTNSQGEVDPDETITDSTEQAESQDKEISEHLNQTTDQQEAVRPIDDQQNAGIANSNAEVANSSSQPNPTENTESTNPTSGDGGEQTRDNVTNGTNGGNLSGTGNSNGLDPETDNNVSPIEDSLKTQTDTSQEGSNGNNPGPENFDEKPEQSSENQLQEEGTASSEPTVKDVPRKVVTGGDGVEYDIPKDVYTVTAVGDAAAIVEMIGGSGRLMATSQSFTNPDGMGYTLCSDVQSGQVQTWWYDDGSQPLEDEYFKELLRRSPDVCFEVYGQTTFSADQISELQDHGIGYVPLPDLTSIERMKEAVMIVANVLDINAANGMDSRRIALSYCDWIDNVIKEVSQIRPRYTLGNVNKYSPDLLYGSFYVTQWRDDISYQRMYEPAFDNPYVELPGLEGGYGSGVALRWTSNKRQPLWEIEKKIWIKPCDATYQPSQESGITEAYVFPYDESFGIPIFSNTNFYYYYEHMYYSTSTSCIYGGYALNGVAGTIGDYQQNNTNNVALGHERYPALIVANDFVRSRIENSPQWKAGYSPNKTDNPIYGDYRILVNPVGFKNWAEGGVDAPLEAYWLAARITGTIDENTLYNRIQSFYESFFGVRLNSSQINAIVNR